ncbi:MULTISPECIES: hypothetical protein [unclassified Anabaena]|uniref:hypothetical protein n=1 Tax=unclassified Anabaena TaxID=2619674 RepID=UPI0014475695|nr:MULTISPECIES: hypothetical protein [unclassified Anabaena]MTJ07876.1 hypothetical protein [Anabaena sp. UHCC 0204]MTJ53640.1 hypothetical protein [Anabaena sp. UHCC 0253]
MAWLFSLSAECGTQTQAELFLGYFQKLSWTLGDGKKITTVPELMEDHDGNWWCMVVPLGMNENLVESDEDTPQIREIGNLLYGSLQNAPDFRYALLGVEVDLFRTFSELLADTTITEQPSSFVGLVLAESIWDMINRPEAFQLFKPGYFWIPFDHDYFCK